MYKDDYLILFFVKLPLVKHSNYIHFDGTLFFQKISQARSTNHIPVWFLEIIKQGVEMKSILPNVKSMYMQFIKDSSILRQYSNRDMENSYLETRHEVII